jgi:SAM-dependent methyltransferase
MDISPDTTTGNTPESYNSEYSKLLDRWGVSFAGVGFKPEECLRSYIVQKRMLEMVEGDRILDVGCGMGWGATQFIDYEYSGIDTSEEHLSIAKSIFLGGDQWFERTSLYEWDGGEVDHVLFAGIFNIGYEWKDIVELVEFAWCNVATRGVGISYQKTSAEGMTTFSTRDWVGLVTRLSDRWACDVSWSEINGVVTTRKVS